jgi:hypothetical protein
MQQAQDGLFASLAALGRVPLMVPCMLLTTCCWQLPCALTAGLQHLADFLTFW